jgi:hypothetical protein
MILATGVLFAVIITIALLRRRIAEGPREKAPHTRRITILGIAHTAHVNMEGSSYAYDCTGHGHFVRVYLENDRLIADDDSEEENPRAASPDEVREWDLLFKTA